MTYYDVHFVQLQRNVLLRVISNLQAALNVNQCSKPF